MYVHNIYIYIFAYICVWLYLLNTLWRECLKIYKKVGGIFSEYSLH